MKDAFFASDPASPLFDEEQAEFRGLKYFPENPALRLTLTRLTRECWLRRGTARAAGGEGSRREDEADRVRP